MVSLKKNAWCVAALAGSLAWAAHAAPAPAAIVVPLPAATVEGVQLPAWVERGASSVRSPLAPGVELGSQDKVITGDNARLLLRLADGSTIKLGEKARLNLNQAEASRESGETTLRATMNVVVGAFRFTTDALNKLRSKREVSIKISTVTAGIRGTDLWGAQRPDREIVCLIEGNITVDRELGSTIESAVLDQPMQFYVALKDKPANPVGTVSAEQLQLWAQETEMGAGQTVVRADGAYQVVFVASDNIMDAFTAQDALRRAGYPASILPVPGKGKHSYQVRLVGLESQEAANALLARFPNYEKSRVVH
jgi:hypothetical protein